ncbi:MAG: dephospho-CoA kinase [Thiotrichales bacterium]|jgi:dephospho-CoA kinase|nr:dephospho-CoA kinase [Thiotrichales bacterium]MBT3614226.1 dephospho-CoA kinase [Thiotrichales bacterium]MBT3752044.1 dephospho-CoA kinase [Thiotrichales bacterium]MBT3837427.1 dephospho-CoA kinase [Thiotrichales bacterium]MBT4152712.1 dephospho-CoA kinase [Thiotrichales bacterium]
MNRKPIPKIGLTGGVGCGKSSIAEIFSEHGAVIVDADIAAREAVTVGSRGLERLKEIFGTQIINSSGELNRDKLRDIIFSNSEHREEVENILHPIINQIIEKKIVAIESAKQQAPYILLVIPLLYEKRESYQLDRVLVVDLPQEIQIERVMQRDNISIDKVKKIIKAQSKAEQRLSMADDILTNINSNDMKKEVKRLHQKYLTL